MEDVYLLLGVNLSNRERQLTEARTRIAAEIGRITAQSELYETASWGGVGTQPDYLNQVVCVASTRSPQDILKAIHRIEEDLGRVRGQKWEARVIDIDILFYGQRVVDLPDLQIPHPYFQDRNFAMIPMVELAPDFIHPRLGVRVADLLASSEDLLEVRSFPGGSTNVRPVPGSTKIGL